MTMPGAPSVSYGGEIGMEGESHNDTNRRCMPWDENISDEKDLRPLIKKLIALRKNHPAFTSAHTRLQYAKGRVLVYSKHAADGDLYVALNFSPRTTRAPLPDAGLYDVYAGCPVSGPVILPGYGFMLCAEQHKKV
jgi:glycosidase